MNPYFTLHGSCAKNGSSPQKELTFERNIDLCSLPGDRLNIRRKGKRSQRPPWLQFRFGLAIATPLGSGKHVPIDRILTEAISLFGV